MSFGDCWTIFSDVILIERTWTHSKQNLWWIRVWCPPREYLGRGRVTTELGFQNVEILSSTQLESRAVMNCSDSSVRGVELETGEKRVICALLDQKASPTKTEAVVITFEENKPCSAFSALFFHFSWAFWNLFRRHFFHYAPIKSDCILIEWVVCPGGCGHVYSFNSLSELRRRTAVSPNGRSKKTGKT